MPVHRNRGMDSVRVLLRLIVVMAVAAMAGCAPPPPLLSPLAPQTLGQSVTARQQVTAHFGDQTSSLQVALRVAPDNLTLIGLTAIGHRLFTLSWKDGKPRLRSRIKPIANLDPARILADLQLAYWPLPALRSALPDDMRLQQYGTARVLWHNNKLLWFSSSAGANRWHSTVTIYNARLGYRLTIRPLSFQTTQ